MSDLNAGAGMHVLIIDDENLSAILSRALLKKSGISNVYICNHPRHLTSILESMPQIDLVLMDLQLPGESGFELLTRLRGMEIYKEKPFPVAVVTAQVLPEVLNQAQAAGFDGFLGKPLNFDRFPRTIQALLSGEKVWDPR